MKIVKFFYQVVFLFVISSTFSQNTRILGRITDSLNVPLENATIIASSKNDLKFTTSNLKGDFFFDLRDSITYKIAVSYMGFLDYETEIVPKNQTVPLLIKLISSVENLKNIEIIYKVEPVLIKKDTVVFDVSKFTNGNERKLRDQLQKLPGIQVSKNGVVTYQGKEVKTTLVENGSFFGGGSKIAVESIPADAVDKIVLLDNFSEVDFMKQVDETGDLIMNVKLKKDKKKFAFGDLTAGHADDTYHKLHANLFYYSPKRNLSLIGDLNNNGTNTLEFEDIFRLESGILSSYSKNRKNFDNYLFQFALNNERVKKTYSKFIAFNYNEKMSNKTNLEAYFLYSINTSFKENSSFIQYVNNSVISNEYRNTQENQKIDFTLFNFKINSRLTDNSNVKYVLNFKETNTFNTNNLISNSNSEINLFDLNNLNEGKSFNHFFEFNRKKSIKKYQTFVFNQGYKETLLNKNWLSNAIFLQDYFPLQSDSSYKVSKDAIVKTNSFDATYSTYWVANNKSTFTLSVIAELLIQDFSERDKQVLSDNTFVEFDSNLYGKNIKSIDSKAAVNLEYKLVLKKWKNIFSLELENLNRNFRNFERELTVERLNLNPNFKSEYKFSEAHVLSFSYEYSNRLSTLEQLATGRNITSFNSVSSGNDNLRFEETNSFGIVYNRKNPFKKYYFDFFAFYNRKNNPIGNSVSFSGINQSIQSVYINQPSDNLTFKGSFTKNIKNLDLVFNTKLNLMKYTQNINEVFSQVDLNNNIFGIQLKTNNVNWPQVSLGYEKTYNTFKSIAVTEFQSNSFYTEIEIEINKSLILKSDYNYTNNINVDDKNYFQIGNAQLEYSKNNNPWLFNLSVNNVFNSKTIESNTISSYLSTFNSVQILPRIFMLKISYKL